MSGPEFNPADEHQPTKEEWDAAMKQNDPVNHPAHYTQGGIECIDAIRAALTEEEFRGFCKGNLIKYAWRERHKGGNESLRKGEFYSRQLTEPRK